LRRRLYRRLHRRLIKARRAAHRRYDYRPLYRRGRRLGCARGRGVRRARRRHWDRGTAFGHRPQVSDGREAGSAGLEYVPGARLYHHRTLFHGPALFLSPAPFFGTAHLFSPAQLLDAAVMAQFHNSQATADGLRRGLGDVHVQPLPTIGGRVAAKMNRLLFSRLLQRLRRPEASSDHRPPRNRDMHAPLMLHPVFGAAENAGTRRTPDIPQMLLTQTASTIYCIQYYYLYFIYNRV